MKIVSRSSSPGDTNRRALNDDPASHGGYLELLNPFLPAAGKTPKHSPAIATTQHGADSEEWMGYLQSLVSDTTSSEKDASTTEEVRDDFEDVEVILSPGASKPPTHRPPLECADTSKRLTTVSDLNRRLQQMKELLNIGDNGSEKKVITSPAMKHLTTVRHVNPLIGGQEDDGDDDKPSSIHWSDESSSSGSDGFFLSKLSTISEEGILSGSFSNTDNVLGDHFHPSKTDSQTGTVKVNYILPPDGDESDTSANRGLESSAIANQNELGSPKPINDQEVKGMPPTPAAQPPPATTPSPPRRRIEPPQVVTFSPSRPMRYQFYKPEEQQQNTSPAADTSLPDELATPSLRICRTLSMDKDKQIELLENETMHLMEEKQNMQKKALDTQNLLLELVEAQKAERHSYNVTFDRMKAQMDSISDEKALLEKSLKEYHESVFKPMTLSNGEEMSSRIQSLERQQEFMKKKLQSAENATRHVRGLVEEERALKRELADECTQLKRRICRLQQDKAALQSSLDETALDSTLCLEELRMSLQEMQTSSKEMETLYAQQQEQVLALETANATLQDESQSVKTHCITLSARITAETSKLNLAMEELACQKRQFDLSREEKESSAKLLQEKEEEICRLQDLVNEETATNDKVSKQYEMEILKNEELYQNLQTLQQRLEEKSQAATELKENVSEEKAKAKNFEELCKQKNLQINSFEREMQMLEDKVQSLTQEVAFLRKTATEESERHKGEIDSMHESKDETTNQLKHAKSEAEKMRELVRALTSSVDEYEQICAQDSKQVESLRESNTKLQENMHKLEREVGGLKHILAKKTALIDDLKAENRELKEKMSDQVLNDKQKCESLTEKRSMIDKLQGVCHEKQQQISSLQQSNENLKKRLGESEVEISKMQERIENYKESWVIQNATIDTLERMRENLAKKLQETDSGLATRLEKLRLNMDSIVSKSENYEATAKMYKEKIYSLLEDKKSMLKSSEEHRSVLTNLEAICSDQQAVLDSLTTDKQNLAVELAENELKVRKLRMLLALLEFHRDSHEQGETRSENK